MFIKKLLVLLFLSTDAAKLFAGFHWGLFGFYCTAPNECYPVPVSCRITDSENYFCWEIPLRSSSPTIFTNSLILLSGSPLPSIKMWECQAQSIAEFLLVFRILFYRENVRVRRINALLPSEIIINWNCFALLIPAFSSENISLYYRTLNPHLKTPCRYTNF